MYSQTFVVNEDEYIKLKFSVIIWFTEIISIIIPKIVQKVHNKSTQNR